MTEEVNLYLNIFIICYLVISIVGVESILHKIVLDESLNSTITSCNAGIMETWFTRITPDNQNFFSSIKN